MESGFVVRKVLRSHVPFINIMIAHNVIDSSYNVGGNMVWPFAYQIQ